MKIQYAGYYYNVFEKILRTSFKKTADDKLEEGEDNVKSVCPLCPGLHTCYNDKEQRVAIQKILVGRILLIS